MNKFFRFINSPENETLNRAWNVVRIFSRCRNKQRQLDERDRNQNNARTNDSTLATAIFSTNTRQLLENRPRTKCKHVVATRERFFLYFLLSLSLFESLCLSSRLYQRWFVVSFRVLDLERKDLSMKFFSFRRFSTKLLD